MDLYRLCVSWCRDDGVTRLPDLYGRVLNAETVVEHWVARCEDAAERLD